MWSKLQRWRGVLLIGIAVVATIVLALSNQLVLYIHPRYIWFTVAMVAVALVAVIASAVMGDSDDAEEPRSVSSKALTAAAFGLAALLAVAMVVLPPATLSSATADQRDINSTTLVSQQGNISSAASAPDAAFEAFTVLDWASLLRQTSDPVFFQGKPVNVVGFITPDKSDPENLFYVSRFFVTCCAVDAQPAGVAVYDPGWSSRLKADDWVQVTGEFSPNPSSASTESLVVVPEQVTSVEPPNEPYLF